MSVEDFYPQPFEDPLLFFCDSVKPRKVTVGDLADRLKELLSDRGVEAAVVVLPSFELKVMRNKEAN